ncbi:MAG: type IV toxin-antitoxin system AbiEi family antitoxin domain-containing protein [Acidimicrobiia bacterium]
MHQDLAGIAGRQYGAFTGRQALASGMSRATLHRWVEEGRLLAPHPGVYAFAGAPLSWDLSVMAALLAAGPEAVVSHRAGARLWSLLEDDTVEITVPRNRSPRIARVVTHRSRDLADHHISSWKRFPVTKPARTIVDLGAVLTPAKLEDVLDRALSRRLLTIAGVERMLSDLSRPGRHGTAVLRVVLDERALGKQAADGMLEPRMARLLRKAGLPPAAFQYPIHAPEGRFLARVDFAYAELLLAVEVDGWATHGSPRAMGKDFVRQNGLVPYGWRVLRFTWAQVVHEPEYVAAVIGRTLAALAA